MGSELDQRYAEYKEYRKEARRLRSEIKKVSLPLDAYSVVNMFHEYIVEKGATRPKDDTLLSLFDLRYEYRREDYKEEAEMVKLLRLVHESFRESVLEVMLMLKLMDLGCKFRVVRGRFELYYIPRD